MSEIALDVKGLDAWYGRLQVLHGVDLRVHDGAIVALLGANGAGKTTTLRAISRMVRSAGDILVQGRHVAGLATEEVTRLGVAHVPDGRGTFVNLNVEDNLKLGAYVRTDRRSVVQDMERMYSYFPRLKERRMQQAGLLSGGEQQMLAISRALMLNPKLLLLDEPSFGVAPQVVAEIFAILRRIRHEQQVAILLVEQNASLALELADSACLLETGKVVLAGSAAEMRSNDVVRRSYLGY